MTRIRRLALVGCGTMIVAAVLVVAWIGISLFPGFGGMESAYHPFRSAKAKAQYLSFYDRRASRWPLPSETTTVETSFGPTFVRISGPAGGRPIVLLHGAGGSSLHWTPNIEALSRRYRTFAVDGIYDYGRSVYTRTIESADQFAEWLDETSTALDLGDDVTLIGLSYGGWLASQYALRFPSRLHKIVMLAPAGTVLPLSADWILRASLSVVPHRRFTRNFLFWLLEDFASKDAASRALLEEEADAVYLAMRSFKLKRLVNPTVLSDSQLQSLTVPALFMVGENEKIYSATRAVRRMNDVAPQIKTAVIPNAGHDLTFVQAELVNREILAFLEQP